MSSEKFTSKYAFDPKASFDIGKLKGKSVVITGGASGLGEEFAKTFVKAGAFVTIGDVNDENGRRVLSELGEDKATFVHCDVLTWTDQVTLFATAVDKSPSKSVDIVCANAGIAGPDTVWRDDAGPNHPPKEPDLSVLKTNLLAPTYTAKLAIHHFTHSRPPQPPFTPILILTASFASYLDSPRMAQYGASKFGIRGLLRSLRHTMPASGMRVNAVAPCFVPTPLMNARVRRRLVEGGARFAVKEDVARAVVRLVCDEGVNGRVAAVVPRSYAEGGYVDMRHDDFEEGDILTDFQDEVGEVEQRRESSASPRLRAKLS